MRKFAMASLLTVGFMLSGSVFAQDAAAAASTTAKPATTKHAHHKVHHKTAKSSAKSSPAAEPATAGSK